MPEAAQPLLHDLELVLCAPTQAWSGRDGQIRGGPAAGVQGVLHSDVRVLSEAVLEVGDEQPEPAGSWRQADGSLVSVGVPRRVGRPGRERTAGGEASVRVVRTRRVEPTGMAEEIELGCALGPAPTVRVALRLAADFARMDAIRSGASGQPVVARASPGGLVWETGAVTSVVEAPGAALDLTDPARPVLAWMLTPAAGAPARVTWRLSARDRIAVVQAPASPVPRAWARPARDGSDPRLQRFLEQSLRDLDRLRLCLTALPGQQFLAAGAPWFLTVFGRDSLWAARFLLPLGTEMAEGTLAVLASLQGDRVDPESREEPGKVVHELRREGLTLHGQRLRLPPRYYGTVDATPLWVCLLHDAWRAGMPDAAVAQLLPHARRALDWVVAAVGDGYVRYLDTTGHGLVNQGWKDSPDSVQFRDGHRATGPVALCEVQAYAHEALVHGAQLLEAFGPAGDSAGGAGPGAGPAQLRGVAAELSVRFRRDFWLDDTVGRYVATALDGEDRPVDAVTSSMGHLLDTGLLTPEEEALVARRLVHPELDSGYGLRTLATSSAAYWPLRYHGGSVWAHDTAVAIRGLARGGFAVEASRLAAGLLEAARSFAYRMPELHAGDPAGAGRPGEAGASRALPYPWACRPQAWSAASSVVVADALAALAPRDGNGRADRG